MTAHTHTEYVPGCFRCDLSREERMSDAVRSITPGPATTGISALTIPPADYARQSMQLAKANQRITELEQQLREVQQP